MPIRAHSSFESVLIQLISSVIMIGCGKVWFVPIHTHREILNNRMEYELTNQLNITSVENSIQEFINNKNNDNTNNNKIMTIYYVEFKIIIVFKEMNTYLASILREQRLHNTGGFINLPSPTFQTCALSVLILLLPHPWKLIVKCLQVLS